MTPFQEKQLALMRQMEKQLASNSCASTIVPMQLDYLNDPQIALTCISYVPEDIAKRIQTELINPLKAVEPDFYYYPNADLHITIQNVRVIHNPPSFTKEDIKKVQSVLASIVPSAGPFPFTYNGLLSMPTSASLIALVTPQYDQFVRRLRKSLTDNTVPDNKTYFTDEVIFANTTIVRYTHAPSQIFVKTLASLQDISVGTWTPKIVSLVTMNAVANPQKTIDYGSFPFKEI